MKDNLRNIHRQALELVNQARELGYVITIDTVPEQPLAMGNHTMLVNVRPARQLDPVTIAMIEDEAQALADLNDEDDEDEICPACNGSGEGMYDGSRCYKCHGIGELSGRSDDSDDAP